MDMSCLNYYSCHNIPLIHQTRLSNLFCWNKQTLCTKDLYSRHWSLTVCTLERVPSLRHQTNVFYFECFICPACFAINVMRLKSRNRVLSVFLIQVGLWLGTKVLPPLPPLSKFDPPRVQVKPMATRSWQYTSCHWYACSTTWPSVTYMQGC